MIDKTVQLNFTVRVLYRAATVLLWTSENAKKHAQHVVGLLKDCVKQVGLL